MIPHRIDLSFKLFAKYAQFVLKLGTEGLEGVINSLRFSFSKVSIGLDFTLDVLEFGFQLFFGLNTLHQHNIVVAVHLNKLVVHRLKWYIIILLVIVTCHVLLD